jgi:hypothetical protein
VPITLSKPNASQAVRLLMTELQPRLARRQVLREIMDKGASHEAYVERKLTAGFSANRYDEGKLESDTRKRLTTVTRLFLSLRSELSGNREEGGKRVAGTLEGRIQGDLIKQVEGVIGLIDRSRKDLASLGVTVTLLPRSPEFLTITRRNTLMDNLRRQPERVYRVKIEDLLAFVQQRRPGTRQFAEYLREGAPTPKR